MDATARPLPPTAPAPGPPRRPAIVVVDDEPAVLAAVDLLTTWQAGAALESGGVRVIGHGFSRDSHELRDFLARNRVPARWVDVERDGEARALLRVAGVDERVFVIGGANSAGQAAVYFSGWAKQVTMLVRADALAKSMSHYLVERIAQVPNVVVRTGAQAVGPEGEGGRLRRLRILDVSGAETLEDADACFVFIGAAPRTDWLDGVVARDGRGFILAGADAKAAGWPLKRDPYVLETTVPGVFVAGDVRARSIKRVASAVGEGSMAVSLIHEYLATA